MTIISSITGDIDTMINQLFYEDIDFSDQSGNKLIEITNETDYTKWESMTDEAILNEKELLVFLGHGNKFGMMGPDFQQYLLSQWNVTEINCPVIGIFCYAREFFSKFPQVSGFFTSMFVSNKDEATYYGLNSTEEEIRLQHKNFLKRIRSLMDSKTPMNEWKSILWKQVDQTNETEVYNYRSLYHQ